MKLRRGYKIALSIIAGILLVFAALVWFLGLIFDESRYILDTCSLAYWILVPDIIHRLLLNHCNEPYYLSSTNERDGPNSFTRFCHHTSDPDTLFAHY